VAQSPHLADFFRLQCHRVVTPNDFIVASGFRVCPICDSETPYSVNGLFRERYFIMGQTARIWHPEGRSLRRRHGLHAHIEPRAPRSREPSERDLNNHKVVPILRDSQIKFEKSQWVTGEPTNCKIDLRFTYELAVVNNALEETCQHQTNCRFRVNAGSAVDLALSLQNKSINIVCM